MIVSSTRIRRGSGQTRGLTMEQSVPFTRVATIVFPSVITLWVTWMSVRLLRRRSALADQHMRQTLGRRAAKGGLR